MRDDEKYPSTITYEQPGLELVPQAPPLPPKDSHGNVFVAELPGTQGGYQHYQPQQHTQQQAQYVAYKPNAPASGYARTEHSTALSEVPPTPGYLSEEQRNTGEFPRGLPPRDVSKKRYCGLPKRVFIAVVALLVVLLIAIIVGAAVAVSNSKKSASPALEQDGSSQNQGSVSSTSVISQPSQTQTSPGSSGSSSSTSSAPSSASSTPPVVRTNFNVQKSAATFSGDGTTNTFLQTFEQNMGTGDINYRLYLSTKKAFQDPQRLALTVSPLIGTAITSTTQYDGSTFSTFVNVFYLAGNATATNLAMANMTCTSTSPTCKTTFNDIIAEDIKYPIHPSSSLAATYLVAAGWRIYYINTDLYISELVHASNGGKWNANVIGGKTSEGTSIAVLNQPPTGLNVYYMDDSAKVTSLTYKGSWTPTTLGPAGDLNATIPIAAVYVPKVFTYQIFYLDTEGAMHSYAKVNSTGTWQPQTAKSWVAADPQTGISATAWDTQIRLFYYSKGKLNQGAVSKVPALAKTAQSWSNAVIS